MNIHVTTKSSKLQHTAFFESFPKNTELCIKVLRRIHTTKASLRSILTILIFKSSGKIRECPGFTIA